MYLTLPDDLLIWDGHQAYGHKKIPEEEMIFIQTDN
jgi:deoxyxylulose-5-phosphate synthase